MSEPTPLVAILDSDFSQILDMKSLRTKVEKMLGIDTSKLDFEALKDLYERAKRAHDAGLRYVPDSYRSPGAYPPVLDGVTERNWQTGETDGRFEPTGKKMWRVTRPGQGRPHFGLDIKAKEGTTVRAAMSGEIVDASCYPDAGLAVTIQHPSPIVGQNLFTRYFHLSTTNVTVGDRIKAGEIVGLSGVTGSAEANNPHLHFQVNLGPGEAWMTTATAIDPASIFGGNNVVGINAGNR